MVNSAVMLCLSASSENKWQTVMKCFPPAPPQDVSPGLGGLRHRGGLSRARLRLSRRRGRILPGWLRGLCFGRSSRAALAQGYQHFACASRGTEKCLNEPRPHFKNNVFLCCARGSDRSNSPLLRCCGARTVCEHFSCKFRPAASSDTLPCTNTT